MGCQAGVEPAKLTTVMKTTTETNTKSYATIKLGIDAHAKWYYVARQLDGATPQPVQKMEIDGLLHFVAKQQGLSRGGDGGQGWSGGGESGVWSGCGGDLEVRPGVPGC